MTIPNHHRPATPKSQAPRPAQHLGLASPPSFARALRRRGLIARAEMNTTLGSTVLDTEGQELVVVSLFEAHLRRRAMEQAFAALRGDPPGVNRP
jgi:hypothetical protein